MTMPTSPIMECHDEVRHPEGSSIATVKDLLEDPHTQSEMMQSTLRWSHLFLHPVNYPLLEITTQ